MLAMAHQHFLEAVTSSSRSGWAAPSGGQVLITLEADLHQGGSSPKHSWITGAGMA